MMHVSVVRATELRELLYSGTAQPKLQLEVARVEFNRQGEVPVLQVTGSIVSGDDRAPYQANYYASDVDWHLNAKPIGVAQMLYGTPREIPEPLAVAVREGVLRAVIMTQPGSNGSPYVAIDACLRVQLRWTGTAYECDHDTWETVEE